MQRNLISALIIATFALTANAKNFSAEYGKLRQMVNQLSVKLKSSDTPTQKIAAIKTTDEEYRAVWAQMREEGLKNPALFDDKDYLHSNELFDLVIALGELKVKDGEFTENSCLSAISLGYSRQINESYPFRSEAKSTIDLIKQICKLAL